jgi:hemerythrin superfamily protein
MTPKLPLDFKASARNQNGFIGRTDQLDERGDVRPSEFLADICHRPVEPCLARAFLCVAIDTIHAHGLLRHKRCVWNFITSLGAESPMSTYPSLARGSITSMIRLDHAHVIALFHRYRPVRSAMRKRAIVRTVCDALEVHATLEEEIFYPSLRQVITASTDDDVLSKSAPEHNEMRGLIADLNSRSSVDDRYDDAFMALMRTVLKHVADEETVLLPTAERLIPERLTALGVDMTRRRGELLRGQTLRMALNSSIASPAVSFTIGIGIGLILLAFCSGAETRRIGSRY